MVRNESDYSEIANAIKISVPRLYKLISENPIIESAFDSSLDNLRVEEALLNSALKGTVSAQTFWLSHKSKNWQENFNTPPEISVNINYCD